MWINIIPIVNIGLIVFGAGFGQSINEVGSFCLAEKLPRAGIVCVYLEMSAKKRASEETLLIVLKLTK